MADQLTHPSSTPPSAQTQLIPPPSAAPLMAAEPVPGLLPGHGLVRVNIQGSVMTSSMIVPSLMIDGRLLTSKYGVNAFQVPAGLHKVEAYAQWMRRYGQASLDVNVPPGAAVDVFYAAPLHQFTTGNMGLTKQRRKGVGVMILLLSLVFVPLIAAMVLAVQFG
jgi:hypothetical protein